MQEIPNTFCPGKWDELILNSNLNYVYGCCKSIPVIFDNDYKKIINIQKSNLLNNIQDPSCVYCWKIENNNGKSRRHEYLSSFNVDTFDEYLNLDKNVNILEINLGNVCNLQCMYCDPKFSSEWVKDVSKKAYPVFTDRYFYKIPIKNKDLADRNFDILKKENPQQLRILGGEPLINKNIWKLLDSVNVAEVALVSNFMVDKNVIDKLISYEDRVNFKLGVSLDATGFLAEYVRHNLNFELLVENLNYFLEHSKTKSISIHSLMTSISIFDIENLYNLVYNLRNKFHDKNIKWLTSVCVTPQIQSFQTLPTEARSHIKDFLKTIKDENFIMGLETVATSLEFESFNKGLHTQLKFFVDEWELRKNVSLPNNIKELLCLNKHQKQI